ncbi:MAG TPA: TonB-dependent receptor [Longimicrobiales bacterium]
MHVHVRKCLPAAFFLTLLLAPSALAQSGQIMGRVTDAESGAPLVGARLEAVAGNDRVAASAFSDQNGQYRLTGLDAGAYTIVITLVGYETQRIEGVRVVAGQTSLQAFTLTAAALQLNPLVVSASKREEKALDAPATVAVVNSQAIEQRPTLTPLDHLRSAPGVDIITYGLRGGNIVLRGFNNIFSGALHMLADYRVARVPGLHVNLMHFIPSIDEDVDRIEVVLGPGSALYGPNTAHGVVHVITKSPLDYQGNMISIAGGPRSTGDGETNDHPIDFMQTQFRSSQLITQNLGVKVSGEVTRGYEWVYVDPAELAAKEDPTFLRRAWTLQGIDPSVIERRIARLGNRDYETEAWSLEARADWRITPDLTTVLSVGRSKAVNSIELTGLGAAQARGWTYDYYQLRANYHRLFAQVYLNTSDAGDSFTLKDGEAVIDHSKVFAAQIQHGFDANERQSFTYGLDFIRTMPESEGTIYGINEDDDNYTEFGAYLQSETALSPKFDLLLAGRIDTHSELDDPVFSPRAGIVYKPRENHNVRLTYNRAFSTPTAINLSLDKSGGLARQLETLGYLTRGQGTGSDGFQFMQDGALTGMRSPFSPFAGLGAPSTLLEARSSTLYQLAVGLLREQGFIDAAQAQALLAIQPADADVGINVFNPLTGTTTPLDATTIPDVPPIQESVTSTYEVGYSGLFGDRLMISADAWYSQYKDFVSPLVPVTPLLMLDGEDLGAYLTPRLLAAGIPSTQAQALVGAMAQIPLAVVSSEQVDAAGADILATYINFGDIDLWGADFAGTFLIDDMWSVGASASFISDDYLEAPILGRVDQPIALNAPKFKGTASLGYNNAERGFRGELRLRHTGEFPANSADYVGTACILPEAEAAAATPCVEAATLFDLTLGYELPFMQGGEVQLGIKNLFDEPYRSFVGVPEIGRLTMLRLTYRF